jgi:GNAT superfamily N-acetyltransferase
MEKIKYLFANPYSQLQNEAIPTLMECFDEWQMFTQMYGFTFPFYEVSFLAIDENTNKVIAHAGIMPFTMTNSDKKVLKVAGLASVATSPQYRKRGIANKLCTLAKEWAIANNFDLMALYTQFFRVYESCNWSIYNTTYQAYQNPNFNGTVVPGLLGSQLTLQQKEIIQSAYNNEEPFTGFVKRNNGDYFHDWNRLFRESFCQWYIKNDSYILAIENVIAEAAGDPKDLLALAQNFPSSFTSKDSKIATILKENNWTKQNLKEEELPFWHHERVMTLPLTKEGKNATLFFSLSDKF